MVTFLVTVMGSMVCGLSSYGSVAVTLRLSGSMACGIFLDHGLNPSSTVVSGKEACPLLPNTGPQ